MLTAMTALLLEVCAPLPSLTNRQHLEMRAFVTLQQSQRRGVVPPPQRVDASGFSLGGLAQNRIKTADISRHWPGCPLNTSLCTGAEQQAYSGQAEKAVTTQEALQHHATLLVELQRAEKDRQRLTQALAVAEQDVRRHPRASKP